MSEKHGSTYQSTKELIVEYASLLWVRLSFSLFSFFEYVKVVLRFYRNRNFRRCDLALLSLYRFDTPYHISKKFLLQQGADDLYVYGETPLTAVATIAKRCHFSPSDTLYEIGCGRGRCCFWIAYFIGCQVVGVEQIPTFVERGNLVKQRHPTPNLQFLCNDMLDIDYSPASIVYLYGTCFDSEFIEKLIEKLTDLKPNSKVITISYPLTDYTKSPLFRLVDQFSLSFGWGEVDIYLQLRI